MGDELLIEYAKTDQECLDVHLFLCVVSQPHLMAPIDPEDSIKGVLDVRDNGFILTVKKDGNLVGSLGLTEMSWWFNTKMNFLTNRWFFIAPQLRHSGIGVLLENEAMVIGEELDLPVLIVSHTKRRNLSRPHFAREKLLVRGEDSDLLWKPNPIDQGHDVQS